MRPARRLRVWLGAAPGLALAAATLWGACSGPAETAPPGGSGGTGGLASTSSTSTSGTAGGGAATGGNGGAGAGSQDWGEAPVWVAFETVVDCALERIENRKQVRAFQWENCGPGCESAVLREGWNLSADNMVEYGVVASTPAATVVSLVEWVGSWLVVLFTTPEGWVLDGYRVLFGPGTGYYCKPLIPNTNGERYGFVVRSGPLNALKTGGVLAPLDESAPPTTFNVVPTPAGTGPQIWNAFGPDRWIWYYNPDKLVSVSTLDGSAFVMLGQYQAAGPILGINGPVWTGDHFLFEQVNLVNPSTVQGVLGRSDGVAPAETFLAAGDGSYYGRPEYAHTHLAWFHGTGQTDVNQFQTVELWSSPYSADAAALVPHKVVDWPVGHIPTDTKGGYGWLVTGAAELAWAKLATFNLATDERRDFAFPIGRTLFQTMGVTPGFAWAMAGTPNVTPMDWLGRFALQ
ncbi:MAG: hypothetical protein HY908_05355 [Myxococcales bacterium]|nr:hypothetical protein [Myxococcales bacterium]